MAEILFPGEDVCDAEGFIRGHGTSLNNNKVTSTYFGRMKQINKLMTVAPIFSFRYTPEIGDVVIGRVTQIFNKKWKIETNSKSDTTLSLSAINLPGVMQRRKSEDDEMNMRSFFDINDLIVCEVQKVSKSGAAALHTRNDKYRKLEDGVLVVVSSSLLVPLKSRFLFKEGIEVIVGANGFIWISSSQYSTESFLKIGMIFKALKELGDKNSLIDVDKIVTSIVQE